MNVTEHFTVEEFTCKDTARTPYPAAWVQDRLVVLCTQLETIRAIYNAPMTIDSGFRTAAYNASRPGTAKFSQHVQGRAADVIVEGVSPEELHQTILDLYHAGAIAIGGLGSYPGFTHVDVRASVRGELAQWAGSRSTNS